MVHLVGIREEVRTRELIARHVLRVLIRKGESMQFCDICLNIKDSAGKSAADCLALAVQLLRTGSAGGEQAFSVVKNTLAMLEAKGGCSSCINDLRAFKSKLAGML